MPKAPDLLAHLRQNNAANRDELDLSELRPGDTLRVATAHTLYEFRLLENRQADLTTNRSDRPSGCVLLHGCTFGLSSTIKPDHLFTGGNLEFTFAGGSMVHTTTAIIGLQMIRRG